MVGECRLPGHRLPVVSSHGGRERHFPGVSFIKALIPSMRVLPLWLKHLPKALPPTAITFGGLGFNMWIFQGHIETTAVTLYIQRCVSDIRTQDVKTCQPNDQPGNSKSNLHAKQQLLNNSMYVTGWINSLHNDSRFPWAGQKCTMTSHIKKTKRFINLSSLQYILEYQLNLK